MSISSEIYYIVKKLGIIFFWSLKIARKKTVLRGNRLGLAKISVLGQARGHAGARLGYAIYNGPDVFFDPINMGLDTISFLIFDTGKRFNFIFSVMTAKKEG